MDLKQRIEVFQEVDANYARSWMAEADVYEELGVYKETAKLVDLKRSQTHVDLGCGFGDLLGELHKRQSKAALVGVDVSPTMLLAGGNLRLAPKKIPAQYMMYQGYEADDNGTVNRVFKYNSRFARIQPGIISLIADDIRSLSVLKKILGNRTIDSGSLMLPGASLSLAFEGHTGAPLDTDAKRRNRVVEVMNQTREAAYKFMAENLSQGKEFVLVERANIDLTASPDQIGRDFFSQRLGNQAAYWDYDRTELLTLGVLRDGALYKLNPNAEGYTELTHGAGSSVALVTDGLQQQINNVTVIMQKVRRNGKKYNKAA